MAKRTTFSSENLTAGELNEMVETLMNLTQVKDPRKLFKLMRDGFFSIKVKDPLCRKVGGFTYLSLTSTGKKGPEWQEDLSNKKVILDLSTLYLLSNGGFKPTSYEKFNIAILDGDLFKDKDRRIEKIGDIAARSQLLPCTHEVAFLLANLLTSEKIGIRQPATIVAMHEPVLNKDGMPSLVTISIDKCISIEFIPANSCYKSLKNVYFLFEAQNTVAKKK